METWKKEKEEKTATAEVPEAFVEVPEAFVGEVVPFARRQLEMTLCGDLGEYGKYRELCYGLYGTLAALGLLPEEIMGNPFMDYAAVTGMSVDGREFWVRVGNGTQGTFLDEELCFRVCG